MLSNITILDFETTGLCPDKNRVVEVGGIIVRGGMPRHSFQFFVQQDLATTPFDAKAQEINKISAEQVASGYPEKKAFALLKWLLAESVIVAHNASFDLSFLNAAYRRHSLGELANDWLCTLAVAQVAVPGIYHSLNGLCAWQGLARTQAHRALGDCTDTLAILSPLLDRHAEKFGTGLPLNAVGTRYELSAEQVAALPSKWWKIEKGGSREL